MNYPLVSVNITTFNRATLLARAIDSVFAQTYAHFEVIVVDDCSSDNTPEMLKRIALAEPRLRFQRNHINKGNAVSRNIALSLSRGEYIAFLDDDDYWSDPEKTQKQIDLLLSYVNTPVQMCCTSIAKDSSLTLTDHIVYIPNHLELAILKGNGFIYSPTVVVAAQVVKKIQFDVNMLRGVDSDFYRTYIIKYKGSICVLPDVTTVVNEREHPRMTSLASSRSIINSILAHIRPIFKFSPSLLMVPGAFFHRFYSISSSLRKLLMLYL